VPALTDIRASAITPPAAMTNTTAKTDIRRMAAGADSAVVKERLPYPSQTDHDRAVAGIQHL